LEGRELPLSRAVTVVALFAALYCVFSLATAYIPTGPFFIQFRPAIAIPMIAALLYPPLIAGLSAAIGTFIASIIRYGSPLLTIFSGTPANFLGFYVMSLVYYMLRKRRGVNWILALIISSLIGLFIGSIIIAVGLWFLALTLVPELASFKSLDFAIQASLILVYAPAPIAIIIVIGVIKVLMKMGYME